MKIAVLVALFGVSLPLAAAADRRAAQRAHAGARPRRPTSVGRGVRAVPARAIVLDEDDDASGAIAAYKRAMALDPTAADIPPSSPTCTCARTRSGSDGGGGAGAEDRAGESRSATRARHGLRGAVGEPERERAARRAAPATQTRTSTKAIEHLEQAIERADRRRPIRTSARCSRASTCAAARYDKAIPC